jgi:hypothetical protein
MGRRGKQRVKMVLPVKVWGRDATGKTFFQLAHTLDINRGGARVGGLLSLVNFDDTVDLQHRHKKARFRVTWVGRPGTPKANQIGVQYVEPDKDIWGLELPEDNAPDSFEDPATKKPAKKPKSGKGAGGKEMRTHERFSMSGGVEIRTSDKAEVGHWTVLSDLSAGGCYVNTATPLALNARPALLLRTGNTEIRTWAAVRTSHPGVGMGLEFTEMTAADRLRMDGLIQGLAGDQPKTTADPAREVAARVKKSTRDLREIDELLKSVDLDPRILREFRAALGHARHTAWALQQWVELQSKNADVLPVVAYLNSERIRIATYLCRNLAAEIGEMDVSRRAVEFENLLSAVEDLFQRLAGFRFAVEDRTAMPAPFPEPPKPQEREPLPSELAAPAEAEEAGPSAPESVQAAGVGVPASTTETREAAPNPAPVTPLAKALSPPPVVEDRRAKKDRRRIKKNKPVSGNKEQRGRRKDRRDKGSAGAA